MTTTNPAEVVARATGATSATYRVEHRNPDGTLTVESEETWTRPASAVTEVRVQSGPTLVQEYADLRVWFAVNETTGRTPEGDAKHRRLCDVVDELRRRYMLPG